MRHERAQGREVQRAPVTSVVSRRCTEYVAPSCTTMWADAGLKVSSDQKITDCAWLVTARRPWVLTHETGPCGGWRITASLVPSKSGHAIAVASSLVLRTHVSERATLMTVAV
tara:strand:- start:187 stop:525 length:339 start_codon:yes stop_codon:yes gene_type:complete